MQKSKRLDCELNISITSSTEITKSFETYRCINPLSRSSSIEERRYVFKQRNFENSRSLLAVVTDCQNLKYADYIKFFKTTSRFTFSKIFTFGKKLSLHFSYASITVSGIFTALFHVSFHSYNSVIVSSKLERHSP